MPVENKKPTAPAIKNADQHKLNAIMEIYRCDITRCIRPFPQGNELALFSWRRLGDAEHHPVPLQLKPAGTVLTALGFTLRIGRLYTRR